MATKMLHNREVLKQVVHILEKQYEICQQSTYP